MFNRLCTTWIVVMLLVWIITQFVRVSGHGVFAKPAHTLGFAMEHGGLWLVYDSDSRGPAAFKVDREAFLRSDQTLVPLSFGRSQPILFWVLIPYWFAAMPAALALWWRKRSRLKPAAFEVKAAQ